MRVEIYMNFGIRSVVEGVKERLHTIVGSAAWFRCVETRLNEILALRFGDEGLELWRCKGIHETRFRNNKKKDLCACQDGEFVCLILDNDGK